MVCFFLPRFLFCFLTVIKDIRFGLGNDGVIMLLNVSVFDERPLVVFFQTTSQLWDCN